MVGDERRVSAEHSGGVWLKVSVTLLSLLCGSVGFNLSQVSSATSYAQEREQLQAVTKDNAEAIRDLTAAVQELRTGEALDKQSIQSVTQAVDQLTRAMQADRRR